MKIAYLSTFYPFRGGIAQFNAALYRTFERDHNIKAFTFTRQYPDMLFPGTSQFVGPDDPADKVPAVKVLDTINPLSYRNTAGKINIFAPELMIMKYWMPFFAPSLGWVARSTRKSGTINITILDNVIPHERRPGDINLTKFFLNQNHGFVVMSEAVKNDLLSLKKDAKYISHPHPLYSHFGNKLQKDEARHRLNIPPDKKVLLFFGFIRDYKGLDLLLEALNILPEDYHLIVAGEVYGNFDSYDSLIIKYQLESRVSRNARYISDEEVPLFFSAADVCVLPYKSATQSGIVGITYHFDLPVIATDVGGLKEMIEPYKTGLMVDKPKAALIAGTIKKYFDEGHARAFVDNIKIYKDLSSWDSLASGILGLYEKIKSKI
jgi:glycosyltransferase involved in cell wall biosynthesis